MVKSLCYLAWQSSGKEGNRSWFLFRCCVYPPLSGCRGEFSAGKRILLWRSQPRYVSVTFWTTGSVRTCTGFCPSVSPLAWLGEKCCWNSPVPSLWGEEKPASVIHGHCVQTWKEATSSSLCLRIQPQNRRPWGLQPLEATSEAPGAHLWGARTLSFYPLVRRWDSILWVFIKGTIGSIWCSVAPLCLTLCDPMNCSTPGFPVLHHLLELAQTHVHWVGDAIQPSHPLSPPFPPALNLSQHQGLFHQVFASGGKSIGSSGYGICKSH